MGVSHFSIEIFCLTVPVNFVRSPSMFPKSSGIEKFFTKEDDIAISQFSVETFFYLTVPESFVGNPSLFP